jgi:hypothetical protein
MGGNENGYRGDGFCVFILNFFFFKKKKRKRKKESRTTDVAHATSPS